MNYQKPCLGFDRFMALRWVNMALELRLTDQNINDSSRQIREWLLQEIPGKETARKTMTQIRRLWLAKNDPYHKLRSQIIDNGLGENHFHWPLLHYGLSLNIFPLFYDVCLTTGRLLKLQTTCRRKDIHQRIQEKYGDPASTSAATDRVIRTLVDWGFLITSDGALSTLLISVDDIKLTQWLIISVLNSQSTKKMPLADLIKAPELLGIQLQDPRAAIRSASNLHFERFLDYEIVVMMG